MFPQTTEVRCKVECIADDVCLVHFRDGTVEGEGLTLREALERLSSEGEKAGDTWVSLIQWYEEIAHKWTNVTDIHEGLPTEVESAIAQLVMADMHDVTYWPTQVMQKVYIPDKVQHIKDRQNA